MLCFVILEFTKIFNEVDKSLKVKMTSKLQDNYPASPIEHIRNDKCFEDVVREEEQIHNNTENWFENDEIIDEFPHEIYEEEEMSLGSDTDLSLHDTRPTMVNHKNHSLKRPCKSNNDQMAAGSDVPNVSENVCTSVKKKWKLTRSLKVCIKNLHDEFANPNNVTRLRTL